MEGRDREMIKTLKIELDSNDGSISSETNMNPIELMGIAEYLIYTGRISYNESIRQGLEKSQDIKPIKRRKVKGTKENG